MSYWHSLTIETNGGGITRLLTLPRCYYLFVETPKNVTTRRIGQTQPFVSVFVCEAEAFNLLDRGCSDKPEDDATREDDDPAPCDRSDTHLDQRSDRRVDWDWRLKTNRLKNNCSRSSKHLGGFSWVGWGWVCLDWVQVVWYTSILKVPCQGRISEEPGRSKGRKHSKIKLEFIILRFFHKFLDKYRF